jgi:hypothetical protein
VRLISITHKSDGMKLLEQPESYIECIHDLSDCIAGGETGTLDDIADNHGCSRNSVKNHKHCLEVLLKKLNVKVSKDRKNNTFRFSKPGTIYICLIIKWGPYPRKS